MHRFRITPVGLGRGGWGRGRRRLAAAGTPLGGPVCLIGPVAVGATGAVVMVTLILSTLGLPLEGVGLLLAIDPILDMMRTATNVAARRWCR